MRSERSSVRHRGWARPATFKPYRARCGRLIKLDAGRSDRRAGRKVVHRGVALGAAHDETLVALGGDIVADRAVASHAAGVRHEHAWLAGNVGAEIPRMRGERKERHM